jgi:hypothetical protein
MKKWCFAIGLATHHDAPPHSSKDPKVGPRVKQREKKEVGA